MPTAPELFASALEAQYDQQCFYCGAPCGRTYATAAWVKDSFTDHSGVAAPASEYVCRGCVAALQEKITVTLPDGSIKKKQKTRTYSWVITSDSATACTKADRPWLLERCLSPPEPPYAISISESGQKHLLYRGVVALSRRPVTVTLEGERIDYAPDDLRGRLILCKRVAAACGQPVLSQERLTDSQAMHLIRHHNEERLPEEWHAVAGEPLTRLAAFFTPKREECRREHPPAAD